MIGCHNVAQWEEHFNKGKDAKRLVVVDFTASWCGPCRFIAPILAEVAKKTPHVMFLKVDVDELKSVAEQYKVSAMPTFVFLKDGEEIDRVVGAKKDELIVAITKHAATEKGETGTAEQGQVISCNSVAHWDEHFKKGKEAKKLVVVDFTASWCGPCRFISPILDEVAKKTPHVLFLKVDVDTLETVAKKFEVAGMPTFVFLKDGEEIDRVVGADKDKLLATVAKHATDGEAVAAETSS